MLSYESPCFVVIIIFGMLLWLQMTLVFGWLLSYFLRRRALLRKVIDDHLDFSRLPKIPEIPLNHYFGVLKNALISSIQCGYHET